MCYNKVGDKMDVLTKFKIKPKNKKIYEEAFIHKSYAHENKINYFYERLEFLGDAVLELIISEYLYNNNSGSEGELTLLRKQFVCEEALYVYSIELGLNKYLKLGHGEVITGGRERVSIVADIFESFLGALYIDQGFFKTKKFVYEYVVPIIEVKNIDVDIEYKTKLQELFQIDGKEIEYEVLKEEGPPHKRKWTIAVKVNNITYGTGVDYTKKGAEQKAAKEALKKVAK